VRAYIFSELQTDIF